MNTIAPLFIRQHSAGVVRTNTDVVGHDNEVIQRCVSAFGGVVQCVDDCGTEELFRNDTVKLLHTYRPCEDACRRFTYFESTCPL